VGEIREAFFACRRNANAPTTERLCREVRGVAEQQPARKKRSQSE